MAGFGPVVRVHEVMRRQDADSVRIGFQQVVGPGQFRIARARPRSGVRPVGQVDRDELDAVGVEQRDNYPRCCR